MEVAVENLSTPHERAAAAASADRSDAAFELGLAQCARGLEAAVGGRFARGEKRLACRRIDDLRICRLISRGFAQFAPAPLRRTPSKPEAAFRRAGRPRARAMPARVLNGAGGPPEPLRYVARSGRLADHLSRGGCDAGTTLDDPNRATPVLQTILYVAPMNPAPGMRRRRTVQRSLVSGRTMKDPRAGLDDDIFSDRPAGSQSKSTEEVAVAALGFTAPAVGGTGEVP
jgi:hypothetical protein